MANKRVQRDCTHVRGVLSFAVALWLVASAQSDTSDAGDVSHSARASLPSSQLIPQLDARRWRCTVSLRAAWTCRATGCWTFQLYKSSATSPTVFLRYIFQNL